MVDFKNLHFVDEDFSLKIYEQTTNDERSTKRKTNDDEVESIDFDIENEHDLKLSSTESDKDFVTLNVTDDGVADMKTFDEIFTINLKTGAEIDHRKAEKLAEKYEKAKSDENQRSMRPSSAVLRPQKSDLPPSNFSWVTLPMIEPEMKKIVSPVSSISSVESEVNDEINEKLTNDDPFKEVESNLFADSRETEKTFPKVLFPLEENEEKIESDSEEIEEIDDDFEDVEEIEDIDQENLLEDVEADEIDAGEYEEPDGKTDAAEIDMQLIESHFEEKFADARSTFRSQLINLKRDVERMMKSSIDGIESKIRSMDSRFTAIENQRPKNSDSNSLDNLKSEIKRLENDLNSLQPQIDSSIDGHSTRIDKRVDKLSSDFFTTIDEKNKQITRSVEQIQRQFNDLSNNVQNIETRETNRDERINELSKEISAKNSENPISIDEINKRIQQQSNELTDIVKNFELKQIEIDKKIQQQSNALRDVVKNFELKQIEIDKKIASRNENVENLIHRDNELKIDALRRDFEAMKTEMNQLTREKIGITRKLKRFEKQEEVSSENESSSAGFDEEKCKQRSASEKPETDQKPIDTRLQSMEDDIKKIISILASFREKSAQLETRSISSQDEAHQLRKRKRQRPKWHRDLDDLREDTDSFVVTPIDYTHKNQTSLVNLIRKTTRLLNDDTIYLESLGKYNFLDQYRGLNGESDGIDSSFIKLASIRADIDYKLSKLNNFVKY